MSRQHCDLEERAHQVDDLIHRWRSGEADAYDQVFTLLHDDLRHIAHRLFKRERVNHTLQTDDLVSQFYLKMTASKSIPWDNYTHFLRGAARVMRQILIDHSRTWGHRPTGKLGHALLDHAEQIPESARIDPAQDLLRVLHLSQALSKLCEHEREMGQIADLHLMVGLTMEEIAFCLNLSPSKVKREWSCAKHFILKEAGV